jgi:hypothetical protein
MEGQIFSWQIVTWETRSVAVAILMVMFWMWIRISMIAQHVTDVELQFRSLDPFDPSGVRF